MAERLLITTRATFAFNTFPETVSVFVSTVASSIGDSKRISPPQRADPVLPVEAVCVEGVIAVV